MVLGTLTALILILITSVNPTGAVLGFVMTTVAIVAVLLCYLWLDRWEPEPPRLLAMAFLWGASVAVVISIILELLTDSVLGAALGGEGPSSPFTVAVGAPLIEEAAKGLFLVIMMTGRRRHEMNSLTDCLVYAGVTAAGFAWIEDIFYIANGETIGESIATAILRLVMSPFAHPLFTTFTGIGVYFALQQRNLVARVSYVLLGYLGAVIMHGLWNGSALIGPKAYLGVYLLWMMPIFALAIALAVYSRRREQKVVAEKLPGMIAAGLTTPAEASWLGSIKGRKQAIGAATRIGGKPAGAAIKAYALQVVELAFVRDRMDRGFADRQVVELFHYETQALYAARAAAGPALHALAGVPQPAPNYYPR